MKNGSWSLFPGWLVQQLGAIFLECATDRRFLYASRERPRELWGL